MVNKRNDSQEGSLFGPEMGAQPSPRAATAQESSAWTFKGLRRYVGGLIAALFSW